MESRSPRLRVHRLRRADVERITGKLIRLHARLSTAAAVRPDAITPEAGRYKDGRIGELVQLAKREGVLPAEDVEPLRVLFERYDVR